MKMKRNFDFYHDLTPDEQREKVRKSNRKKGDLVLIVMNSIQNCIHSKVVANEQEFVSLLFRNITHR